MDLSNFRNLTDFRCSNTYITNLDLLNPPNLSNLEYKYSKLGMDEVNVLSSLKNLQPLGMGSINLTSVPTRFKLDNPTLSVSKGSKLKLKASLKTFDTANYIKDTTAISELNTIYSMILLASYALLARTYISL